MVALYLSMRALGKQEGSEGAKKEKMEEMGEEIARATFSSPEQKMVITGGEEPIMVFSTEKISYVQVYIHFYPGCAVDVCTVYEVILMQVAKVERVVDTTGAGETLPGSGFVHLPPSLKVMQLLELSLLPVLLTSPSRKVSGGRTVNIQDMRRSKR